MILLDFYKNKRVGVLGFGKTGKSIVDSLMLSGVEVKLYDDHVIPSEKYRNLSIADLDGVKKLNVLVVSPGISLIWPKVHPIVDTTKKNSIPILNDVDLFQQHVKDKIVICITGTNGKSTTTALIYHLLNFAGKKAEIGGNFGSPILSLNPSADFFVLELSSYQLESCNIMGFNIAILLNITPDHLTRHGGMEGYVASKQKIFANFHENSIAIIGVDNEHCAKVFEFLKKIKHPRVIPISGRKVPASGIGWDKNKLIDDRFGSGKIVCEKCSILDGFHNRQNIAAAYAACSNLVKESFCEGLLSFNGLEHRQEIVACIDGVQYINDSKATNVDSVEQALKRFNNIIWILGGRPKEDGIERLSAYFKKIRFALLTGEAAKNWSHLLARYGVKNEISETLDAAVRRSREVAQTYNAKIVLLSPACASFDQFKDFEDRGNKFKELVFKEKIK